MIAWWLSIIRVEFFALFLLMMMMMSSMFFSLGVNQRVDFAFWTTT